MANNNDIGVPNFSGGTNTTASGASGSPSLGASTLASSLYSSNYYVANTATGARIWSTAGLNKVSFTVPPKKPDYNLKEYMKVFSRHAKKST